MHTYKRIFIAAMIIIDRTGSPCPEHFNKGQPVCRQFRSADLDEWREYSMEQVERFWREL